MPIVVASIPSGHVYVRHLSDPAGGDGVIRLPDPPPAAAAAGAWWPPVMLEPGWVDANACDFDLMHIHFGFDACTPAELRNLVQALASAGKPLVVTVHDLRNPHHLTRTLHEEQLGVLVRAANALITLTEGAAAEIKERWGRDALVLPHPHVVEAERLIRPRPAQVRFTIGVHVKSLRASMDPLPRIRALVPALPAMPHARLRVDAHTDVMTPGFANHEPHLAGYLRDAGQEALLDLRVHDYFTDAELWDYLESLDLSLLPYRFGTHSGWLEACHDLGTAVLAPDCGYYAEQRPCLTYPVTEAGADTAAMVDAVGRAYRERPGWRADPASRRAERAWIAAEHRRLCAALVKDGAACMSS